MSPPNSNALLGGPRVLPPLKTWSHLAGARRRPTEYEVVSVGLHYHTRHPACAWELDPSLFMNEWYRRHREGSALGPRQGKRWDDFRDPDALIYRGYVRLQNEQETHVEALLDQHDERGHDATLSPAWQEALARWITPGRYPRHALQMASAYAGQMAPASTITNCCFFQAADEARLGQRLAYRTAELRLHCPGRGFGATERAVWEQDPIWQGFRELLERALVAWDWGESFAAVNLVAKPALDEANLRQLAVTARAAGDELHALLCESHLRDVARARRWTLALVSFLDESSLPAGRDALRGWVARYVPLADRAIEQHLAPLPGGARAAQQARAACAAFRASAGLG